MSEIPHQNISTEHSEDVEGIEADPEVLRAGEYDQDSAIGSDLDSTRSASITSSIVRRTGTITCFLCQIRMLTLLQPLRLATNTRTAAATTLCVW